MNKITQKQILEALEDARNMIIELNYLHEDGENHLEDPRYEAILELQDKVEDEWNDVKVSLPRAQQPVLLCDEDGRVVNYTMCLSGNRWETFPEGSRWPYKTTYWRYLPEPPVV